MRATMCSSLLQTLNYSNPSAQVLETMATALLQSYNPSQVLSSATRSLCSSLLSKISRLSLSYLGKSDAATLPGTIARAISLFVSSGGSSSAAVDAVKDFTEGVLKSLVGGQTPTEITAGGVRTNVQKSLPRYSPLIISVPYPDYASNSPYKNIAACWRMRRFHRRKLLLRFNTKL